MSDAPSLEQRMDDVRAVMDDINSQRAVLLGFSEGCPMSALFAATYPERVSHLILFGGFASGTSRSVTPELLEAHHSQLVKNWGAGVMFKAALGNQVPTPEAVAQFAKFERLSASPGALKTVLRLNSQIDVTSILPTVRVPTLVLHRRTDAQMPVKLGRALAAQIPDAKYIEYPDGDHAFWTGDVETLLGDIEEFVTGHRESPSTELERVLATVLFTDIVDSTRSAAEMGDQNWRRSMAPVARCDVLWPSERRLSKSVCPCAPVSIPARSRFGVATSAGSRCMRPLALWLNLSLAKFWFQGLLPILWLAQA